MRKERPVQYHNSVGIIKLKKSLLLFAIPKHQRWEKGWISVTIHICLFHMTSQLLVMKVITPLTLVENSHHHWGQMSWCVTTGASYRLMIRTKCLNFLHKLKHWSCVLSWIELKAYSTLGHGSNHHCIFMLIMKLNWLLAKPAETMAQFDSMLLPFYYFLPDIINDIKLEWI